MLTILILLQALISTPSFADTTGEIVTVESPVITIEEKGTIGKGTIGKGTIGKGEVGMACVDEDGVVHLWNSENRDAEGRSDYDNCVNQVVQKLRLTPPESLCGVNSCTRFNPALDQVINGSIGGYQSFRNLFESQFGYFKQ